ncbi:hypothetical protein BU16DRAFT_536138 [Lophium mytilinum]|uniref:F-box domain-containing protein n=1 Tax=Lophium mytilinum TaxID=390894 RepID=A0A6A6R625_9PEZI|nr:hypothetical protein BU16DRAFT_536138 [Lophium mytilinum]
MPFNNARANHLADLALYLAERGDFPKLKFNGLLYQYSPSHKQWILYRPRRYGHISTCFRNLHDTIAGPARRLAHLYYWKRREPERQHNETRSPLYQLPSELLLMISDHLQPAARLALRLTCTRFHVVLKPGLRILSFSDVQGIRDVVQHERYKDLCAAEHAQRLPLLHRNYGCSGCRRLHIARAFEPAQLVLCPETRVCRAAQAVCGKSARRVWSRHLLMQVPTSKWYGADDMLAALRKLRRAVPVPLCRHRSIYDPDISKVVRFHCCEEFELMEDSVRGSVLECESCLINWRVWRVPALTEDGERKEVDNVVLVVERSFRGVSGPDCEGLDRTQKREKQERIWEEVWNGAKYL